MRVIPRGIVSVQWRVVLICFASIDQYSCIPLRVNVIMHDLVIMNKHVTYGYHRDKFLQDKCCIHSNFGMKHFLQ